MSASPIPFIKARYFNLAGNAPLAGGKVFTYVAGTNTPLASYTDASGLTPNTNPVILDASGYADIWLIGNYKIILQDANGVQQWSEDNIADFSSQLTSAVGSIINIWGGTTAGTPNAVTVTPSPALTALQTGQTIRAFIFQNNTAAATLSPSGLTAKPIKKFNGSQLVDVVAGDLQVNTIAEFEYDGTQWELLNPRPFSQGASVASAATLVLDSTTGVYIFVTGTISVTAITLAQGQFRRCVAPSGFTLTNGANLICPNGVNAVIPANGIFDVFGEAAGVVRIMPEFFLPAQTAKGFLTSDGTTLSFSLGALNYNNMIHVRDEKTSGTEGGSAGAATTQQRNLNTVIVNNISGASLASNQVTLPAGTYWITGWAPAEQVNSHKTRVFNITDSVYVIEGSVEQTSTSNQTNSLFSYVITIASAKVFELRHYTQTGVTTSGLGHSSSQGTEIYSNFIAWKVA